MLPVQRDFRDVTARLRLLSLGTLREDCTQEHMETAILMLGMSRSHSMIDHTKLLLTSQRCERWSQLPMQCCALLIGR